MTKPFWTVPTDSESALGLQLLTWPAIRVVLDRLDLSDRSFPHKARRAFSRFRLEVQR